MHVKARAQEISAFVFHIMFVSLLIYQVGQLRTLEDDPTTKWYVYAGLGIMMLLVLINQVLSTRIPRLLQQAAGLGSFVCQWFDWAQMPVFAVAYLVCLGLFLRPYISAHFLPQGDGEKLQRENTVPASILPYFGIALGVLLGRYLLLLTLMDLTTIFQVCLVIGTILSLVDMPLQSRSEILTQGVNTNKSLQTGVIFAMSFLLMEANVLARYSPALSFWPIETYIAIRLGALAITTVAHLVTDGRKLFAPAVFLGAAAILLVWGNIPLLLAAINLLFEFLLINMLFIMPFLPIKQDRQPSRRLGLANFGFWFVALGIFVGGQFIFFRVDEIYQFLALIIGGGIIFATWVKPVMTHWNRKIAGGKSS